MSERDSRTHKKYFGVGLGVNKDKKDALPIGSRRQPIILAKPDRDRDSERDKDKLTESRVSNIPRTAERSQPAISILRTREGENRAVSPSHRAVGVAKKELDPQQPILYQLATKHGGGDNINPLSPPTDMKTSVSLLDESLQFSDTALEYLLDQNDFLVVGCLGLQGVGKSTIMSLLAGSNLGDVNKTSHIFAPASHEHHESGSHCTAGVDLYVTSNRVIFLDTQPMLSPSIMDRLLTLEAKKFYVPEFSSTENTMEMQSLQVAAFILSVCHVVLVVQDWFFDPNFVRFLQTAEMLKPSAPITTQDEEIVEYFPHVMFVQNRAQSSDFSQDRVRLMQDVYLKMFAQSKLQVQSGMGLATGNIINYLSPDTCGEEINLFLLPQVEDSIDRGHFKGHPGIRELVQKLQEQLLGVTRNQLTHATLSEKNWCHYSAKVWEAVTKKSSFFMEYSRLLP